MPVSIQVLIDILITVGLIAGMVWIVKTAKQRSISSKKSCERCGNIRETQTYNAQSTDTTRDYYKLTKEFPFSKPLNLCFSCISAHESFITILSILTIEKSLRSGRYEEIKKAEKDLGNQGLPMLALLYLANTDIGAARRILDRESFKEIKPWLDEHLRLSAKK